MFISNNRASFHLWWKKNLVKNQKVSKYYENDCRFNDIFSRNNLSGIKDGAYVINADDKNSKGTHWVSIFIDRITVIYFNSSGIKCISKKVLNKINYSQRI